MDGSCTRAGHAKQLRGGAVLCCAVLGGYDRVRRGAAGAGAGVFVGFVLAFLPNWNMR